jgi:hypothetical protein
LKVLLFWGAGLLFAIFVGWNIGTANYWQLILGAVVFGGAFIAFFSGRFFWVLTIASSFLAGTFPILGGQFTPFQILMGVGVTKFFIEDIVLRRTRLKTGDKFDKIMIAGFMGILTLHAIHDRFGMRFLGSSVWGGKNYVNVYVGLAAFFVVRSIPMQSKIWAKFPYVVFAVTSFDLLIAVITTIFPASIYKIYPFYSAVSLLGLEEIIRGESDVTGRIGGFGNFGFILITIILASISLRKILNPKNLLHLMCLIAGCVTVVYSGFRSAVLDTLIGFVAAGIRDLKFKILLLLPFLALLLFGLSVLNSEVIHLPKQVQRSLAFLPGKWDAEMAGDAAASNNFRTQTWTVWTREYFPLHPWLGRGFGFRSQWAQQSRYNPTAVDYRQTVEVGNIHNGFFASLDAFGVIGTAAFVIWNLRLLARALQVPFRKDDQAGMVLRFIALYLAVSIISYWIGAQNIGAFLPQEFALAGLFLRLQQEVELAPKVTPASSKQDTVTRSLAVA